MAAEEKLALPSDDFFSAVKYHVLGTLQDKTEELLNSGGATAKTYLSADVTHCLAGPDAESEALEEVFEIYEQIPVLRGDAWVQSSVRCAQQLPASCFEAVPSKVAAGHMFKNLHFSTSGLGIKDVNRLWALISTHGGSFSRELRASKTTHLICATKSNSLKFEKATTKKDKLTLVTPDFVIECVKAKALLPSSTFHPRLLVRPGESTETPKPRKVKKKKPLVEKPQLAAKESVEVVKPPEVPQQPPSQATVPPRTQPQAQQPPLQTQQPQNEAATLNPAKTSPTVQVPPTSLPVATSAPTQQPPRPPQPQQAQQPQQITQPQQPQQTPVRPPMNQPRQRFPMQQQQPNVSQQNVSVAQQPPMRMMMTQQMRPGMPQQQHLPQQQQMGGHMNMMSQQQQPQNPMMSQHNVMTSQHNVMTSQHNAMTSQHNVMTSQFNAMTSQHSPMTSQHSVMTSQHSVMTSQHNAMTSQHSPMTSQYQMVSQHQQMSYANTSMAQSHPMVSQQSQQPIMSHQASQQQFQQQQQQMQYQQQQQPNQQYPQQQQQQQPQQYPQQAQQAQQQQNWQQQQQYQQSQQYQQQQQWQQQPQPRPQNPLLMRQQQIIQQHMASLSMEDRAKFTQMSAHEKQEYLAQRNLLIAKQMHTTIILTDQQKELLQTMDQQQQINFIQKLRHEREMQVRQQQQQQPQMMRPQGPHPQQQQFAAQQQQQQQQQYQVRAPHSSPQPPQLSPVTSNVQRPQWSGETHPALAQVPRTPQQLQHLQRLQMQREQQQQQQQQISPNQQQMVRPPVPCAVPQQQPPQPQQPQNGSLQKTKAALQTMLSNRAMSPQQAAQQQQPQPTSQPQQPPQPLQPPQPPQRLQMINVQQQGPPQMMGNQAMFQQRAPPPQGPPQFMQQPPGMPAGPRGPQVPPGPHQMQMPPGAAPPQHAMRFAGPGGMPPGGQRPPGPPGPPGPPVGMQAQQPRPPMPRPLFQGHDPGTKLPPDLCLFGCIFFICDYQDDPEQSKFCDDWKKVIRQLGGEVEDNYHPRITHLLCKTQDSAVSIQALREGKRLVTVFWLNDTVVKKVVLPPWKAVHFPLPANFDRPCENMILTLTGFEGRDRDWVKEMIKIAGAKYTSYFTKHNHAIICRSCEGEKFKKAKEWKVPTVSIQWLNDVFFGNMNAVQCMNNPKYQNFRVDDPFKIEYSLVPNLMVAWKTPIRITPETYQKFKQNPPARIKRKAEKQRLEKEEAKRMREAEEQQNQSAIDPTTGQFIPPQPPIPLNGDDSKLVNGDVSSVKENGDANSDDHHMDQSDNHDDSKIKEEPKDSSDNVENNKLRIMLSGFVKSEYEELRSMVKDLGVEVTSQAKNATHLVMPKMGRTISFLCAISYVKFILKPEWIRQSHKDKKLLDVAEYRLQDPEFEKNFGCNITKTLQKPDRHKLFEGRVFYLTPSIFPSWKKLKLVIEAAGGRVENRRRRNVDQIREVNKPDRDPVYLIITCEHDLHIVTDVLKAKIGIFNTEFIMSAVMKGKMDFDLTRSITTV